jgi:hypothetical protein
MQTLSRETFRTPQRSAFGRELGGAALLPLL